MAVQIPGIAQPYKLPEVAGPIDVLQAQGMQSQNALRDLTVQQGQQELQTTNAMKRLLSQPGALDKDGLPTPQAINAMWAVNPTAAMTAAKEMSGIRNQRATMDMHKVDMAIKQLELGRAADKESVDVYAAAIENGANPIQATAQANAHQLKKYEELIKQDSTLKPPEPFDLPKAQRNILTAAQQHQDLTQARQFAQQETMQGLRDVAAESREDRRDARQERSLAASDARHARTLEAATGGGSGKAPAGYRWSVEKPGELEPIPGGPATGPGKGEDKPLTEAQAKGTAYAAMMGHATTVFDRLKKSGFTGEALNEQVMVQNAMGEGIPYVPGSGILQRGMSSTKAQEAAQAQMLWGEAALRFLTGAAATKDEIVRTAATYFPRSGDKPDVVAQKREARRAMEEAIRITAGRGATKIPAMPPTSGASGEWKIEKVE